jgi:hypothetical protein
LRSITLKTTTDPDSLSVTGSLPEPPAEIPEDLSEVMDFSAYDLRTTIRLVALSGESRRIDVKKGSQFGSIHIRGGEICRVQTADRVGDEAFFEIISWKGETHTDAQDRSLCEPNVRIPTQVFLDLLKNRA